MDILVNRVIVLSAAILLWAGQARACYQVDRVVRVKAHFLSGSVAVKGKAISGPWLALYTWRQVKLDDVTTDVHGQFTFKEVPAGRYLLVSSDGRTHVELVAPSKSERDIVLIDHFGLGCVSAKVISASGHGTLDL